MDLDAKTISTRLSKLTRSARPVAGLDSSAVSRRISNAIARRQPSITAASADKHLDRLQEKLADRARSLRR
jgi:hypothetical protein